MPDNNNLLADLEGMPESYYGFIFHYYRAEVYRETNWRNRMDTTTNWSIVVTGAMLSYAFSNDAAPHSIILVNYLIVWFFLYIESRRFRYYWHLRQRTRLLEKNLLTPLFSSKGRKMNQNNWREKIAESFNTHTIDMSRLESVAWRMRRNYFVILPLIFVSWLAKVQFFPHIASNMTEYFYNARVWLFPGVMVFTLFLTSIIAAIAIALYVPFSGHPSDMP